MAKQPSDCARKLRMGMVGGGPGAFIGAVHRQAARLDGQIELVAGAFSRDPKKSRQQGRELYLDPSRVYGSHTEMLKQELARPENERIDFVSIVTPNDSHFPITRDCLNAGFHVILDKPMTMNVHEAKTLQKLAKKTRRVLAIISPIT